MQNPCFQRATSQLCSWLPSWQRGLNKSLYKMPHHNWNVIFYRFSYKYLLLWIAWPMPGYSCYWILAILKGKLKSCHQLVCKWPCQRVSLFFYDWIYVMRSREVSLKSNMWHSQFSIWLKCSLWEVYFAENPTWIRPVVLKL